MNALPQIKAVTRQKDSALTAGHNGVARLAVSSAGLISLKEQPGQREATCGWDDGRWRQMKNYCTTQRLQGQYSGYADILVNWIRKTNTTGNMQWFKTFDNSVTNEWIGDFRITKRKEIVNVGTTALGLIGGRDILLIKTDTSGNLLWNKNYGSILFESRQELVIANNGRFLLTGTMNAQPSKYYFGFSSEGAAYLLKTDSAGIALWTHLYGAGNTMHEKGYSLLLIDYNKIFVCGMIGYYLTHPAHGLNLKKTWLFETDTGGDINWSKGYTYSIFERDVASLVKTSVGGFIMVRYVGVEGAVYATASDIDVLNH
jgi:hypothetical protein